MDSPWKTEVIPLPWSHAGFDCAIIRTEEMGHLCGYVRIPESHPLFGVDYRDAVPETLQLAAKAMRESVIGKRGIIDVFLIAAGEDVRAGMLFDVHGSITYSAISNYDLPDGFWYGFDCAHSGDLSPFMLERNPDLAALLDGVYRDVAYVKAECESLAEQMECLMALCE